MSKVKGFTLIEVLVSMGILSLVIVAATGLFFFAIRGGKKTDIVTKIKQNGDYALNLMKTKIRNAKAVSCQGAKITVANPEGNQTIFDLTGGRLRSTTDGKSGFLTSEEFKTSGLSFSCSSETPTVVSLTFSLSKSGGVEETASQTFQTTVSLRSY